MTIESLFDVDALAISDPARYQELLAGFFLVLGERRLWWQCCADTDRPRWKACMRAAIVKVATRSGCAAAWLADMLDLGALPRTQIRVMRIARELLYAAEVAA
jgi:hypothetical protein